MASFDTWLENFRMEFLNLNNHHRERTLSMLISILDTEQMYYMSQALLVLLRRDFISQLPIEIANYLLKLCKNETLLVCCRVSKRWNTIISGYSELWRKACVSVGIFPAVAQSEFKRITNECEFNYKDTYIQHKRMMCSRRIDTSTTALLLSGHSEKITTVFYCNGFLGSGSFDRTVRMWDIQAKICTKTLHVHSVADLKFYSYGLFTASYDTTAGSWDLDGNIRQLFPGHVGAVFSVDYNPKADILVTGSADATVKIWRLSTGTLLKTVTKSRDSWVRQVCLYARTSTNTRRQDEECRQSPAARNDVYTVEMNSSASANINEYFILCRDDNSLYLWLIEVSNKSVTNRSSEEWINDLNMVMLPDFHQIDGRFLLAFFDKESNFVDIYQIPLNTTSVSPELDILSQMTRIYSCALPEESTPQCYLGSGSVWTALITQQHEKYQLFVSQHLPHHTNFSIDLPAIQRKPTRCSTCTLCERGWLDGLIHLKDGQPFLAIALPNNCIHVLLWKLDNDKHFSCVLKRR